MFGQDIQELRKVYFDAWEKFNQQAILTPLEHIIAQVILSHPEYHDFFLDRKNLSVTLTHTDGTPHFFHLGLHVALGEQLQADRPLGIKAIYNQLLALYFDPLEVEHKMIHCLMAFLAESANSPAAPNEQKYLAKLEKLVC
jgi:hypothetical protein